VFGRTDGPTFLDSPTKYHWFDGFRHCQVDTVTVRLQSMWDWIEDVLEPGL
jgi:hypothetical protein